MVTHSQRKCFGVLFSREGENSADDLWGWRVGDVSRSTNGVDLGSRYGSETRGMIITDLINHCCQELDALIGQILDKFSVTCSNLTVEKMFIPPPQI